MTRPMDRRYFIQRMATSAGCLGIGFQWGCGPSEISAESVAHDLTAWIKIRPDNRVMIYTSQSEMGQGVLTALPAIVADELDVSWEQVDVAMPKSDPVYNIKRGRRVTSRSESIIFGFTPMRQVGAVARQMLLSAAARRWQVPIDECSTATGVVHHAASNKSLAYGLLAREASQLPVPDDANLKDPSDWSLIGRPLPRKDVEDKVLGQTVFGTDVAFDGLLTATLAACPIYGGTLKSVDSAPALAIAGVRDVVVFDDFIAVVANGYWQAKRGLDALTPIWNTEGIDRIDNRDVDRRMQQGLRLEGFPGRTKGEVEPALERAANLVEADYFVPYLAHACMEPMNATVHIVDDQVHVWAPTQAQSDSVVAIAAALEVPEDNINLMTTFLGGGFGRRSYVDFCVQAALIAKQIDAPVKLIWSREEDLSHSYFRPAMAARYKAGLDEDGNVIALAAHLAGPSMGKSFKLPPNMEAPINVTGASGDAYLFPNLALSFTEVSNPIKYGIWRATVLSHNGFFAESFIDELAYAGGHDPLAFRRLLTLKTPRAAAVLDSIERLSQYQSERPATQGIGFSLIAGWKSLCAIAVNVTMVENNTVRIDHVYCVADCGLIVNPSIVEAQLEGGIHFGLSAAMFGQVEFHDSRVLNRNFDGYRVLRNDQAPPIDVALISSDESPGGVGELSTAGIAPALTNAIYAASGKRIRSLPISKNGTELAG